MRNHSTRSENASIFGAALCLIAALSLPMSSGCDKDELAEPHPGVPALIGHSDCKNSIRASSSSGGAAENPGCIEYTLREDGVLLLKHVNAAFNCCPGEITADISNKSDTITNVEHEAQAGCRCQCLYDLDYRFEDIAHGIYTILVVEPYVTNADEPLRSTIDLSASPSGSFCVERDSYPWNTGGGAAPVGSLVSRTECGGAMHPAGEETAPTDLSCAVWTYRPDGVLSLVHMNAAFNCCPGEITADIRIQNDTITIVEREEQSMCDCSCLYTLRFEIRNHEPHAYTILFVEPYVQPIDERLEFTADLAALPAGMACAYRGHYPWMYQSTMEEDRAKLETMRKRIVDLIATPSCNGEGECRYIGLGAKPCGGVWEYLVYSTANVDRIELALLVSRYNALNDGYNRRYNIASDCMIVMPPSVGCIEGLCANIGSLAQ